MDNNTDFWENIEVKGSNLFLGATKSQNFTNTLKRAANVAKFETSVLIVGETGVGKEVIARFIHQLSKRASRSFLAINCGALPETLLESELFGHKAGAYTGAVGDRIGVFEQAARGTILLDEIGEISPTIQIKLLRVLQEKEILKIGENLPRKIDTRIIASTNCDLDQAVHDHKFRSDLLYRLRVVEIKVPPLRERSEDILPLTEYMILKISKRLELSRISLTPECYDHFLKYSWPGNVRELQNAIESAAIFSGDGNIEPKHLPPQILNPESNLHQFNTETPKSLKELEAEYIKYILNRTSGNRTRTAKILGIGQATLWRKLKEIGT